MSSSQMAGQHGNIVAAVLYAASIVASCIGEGWAYYLLGSAVEVVLLVAIVRTAWTWPAAPGIVGRRESLA
jgi:hypothetical protein